MFVRRGICKDGKNDAAGAAADYDAALAMDANFAPAHYYYGLSLAPKDKKAALDHLDKAAAGGRRQGHRPRCEEEGRRAPRRRCRPRASRRSSARLPPFGGLKASSWER